MARHWHAQRDVGLVAEVEEHAAAGVVAPVVERYEKALLVPDDRIKLIRGNGFIDRGESLYLCAALGGGDQLK